MPYVFTNDDLQHLRECPICGKVIESAVSSPDHIMTYKHYDKSLCLANIIEQKETE